MIATVKKLTWLKYMKHVACETITAWGVQGPWEALLCKVQAAAPHASPTQDHSRYSPACPLLPAPLLHSNVVET